MTDHQHGPPIKVEAGAPHHQDDRPSTNNAGGHDTTKDQRSLVGHQQDARRAASWRSSRLACGCRDPWPCRCGQAEPTTGNERAVQHLVGLGLLPAPNREGLRVMWRRGGQSRQAAEFIAERWDLAA